MFDCFLWMLGPCLGNYDLKKMGSSLIDLLSAAIQSSLFLCSLLLRVGRLGDRQMAQSSSGMVTL